MTTTGLELRSLITADGTLELALAEVTPPEPGPGEVLVRVEAAPINPSDLGMIFGPADVTKVEAGGTPDRPTVTVPIPPERLPGFAKRIGHAMAIGNEGAGTVVAAGAGAEELIGRTVATSTLGMYAQYRVAKAAACVVLPDGTAPRDGASAFVNPLTVLGMVETMRLEGHTALVHTAAASNLGQMLNRVCLADGIGLVNIVRSAEQVALLEGLGAPYVLDSTTESFERDLTDAIADTGATLAFDAIGGGTLAATILSSMEQAITRDETAYNRYGSSTHKQVYLYGGLDSSPTVITRSFGMAWGVGGWLMTPFLQRIGREGAQRLRARVAAELTTTFASGYTAEISLREMLSPEIIAAYGKPKTGEKYLVTPAKSQ